MSAAVAAAVPAEPEPAAETSAPKTERDVVIVDVQADGKTVNFTTSFTMTWKNPETGVIKQGTFTAQRPTLGMLSKIAVLKAQMDGGQKLDPNTDFYHVMVSALQIILVDFPEWWQPADFFDTSPITEVWSHVRSWLDTFRGKGVG